MRRNFFSEDFVRVISGKARGLKLISPAGNSTRPTLDRVKEALFSMLLPYLNEASVLDLFAGSGALGIEALSRGADKAVFVDSSNTAIDCVKKNLAAAKLENSATVIMSSSESYLKKCTEKFDIIFLDPPYAQSLYEDSLMLIEKYNLLSESGIIVVEWDCDIGFNGKISRFKVLKDKKYGRVGITVLK